MITSLGENDLIILDAMVLITACMKIDSVIANLANFISL